MSNRIQGLQSLADVERELNAFIASVEDRLRNVPRLNRFGDLDMRGKRIMRVGATAQRDDAPSRKELERKGLYETPDGNHVANSNLIVSGGIRSTRRAKEPDELVPLRQVQQMIGAGGASDAVVTANTDQLVEGYKQFRGLALSAYAVTAVNGVNAAITIAQSSGPVGGFIRVTGPTAAFSIAGIRRYALGGDGGFTGQLLVLHNATNFTMTLLHESAGASAENRIRCPQSTATATAGMTIRRYGSVVLIYSNIDARWVCASFA